MLPFQPEFRGNGAASCAARKLRLGVATLVLLLLSGCAELTDILVDSISETLSVCYGCTWIIQEWDDDGWNTHNSDPYDTEELCQQELARQTRESPERGHRCINKGDRDALQAKQQAQDFCYNCDWVVQIAEYQGWERIESDTYRTEGACQQVLSQQTRNNPDRNYRCVNLDR